MNFRSNLMLFRESKKEISDKASDPSVTDSMMEQYYADEMDKLFEEEFQLILDYGSKGDEDAEVNDDDLDELFMFAHRNLDKIMNNDQEPGLLEDCVNSIKTEVTDPKSVFIRVRLSPYFLSYVN